MTAKIVGGQKFAGELAKIAAKASGAKQVDVGFFADATYPNGTPVAQVAFWDEFGTKTAPSHPFMRPVAKDGEATWGKLAEAALKHSGMDAAQALEIIGRQVQGEIQDKIKAMDSPANSVVTNLLKNRFPEGVYTAADVWQAFEDAKAGMTAPPGKPLVWSGQMLNSVEFEVKK
jgi:hypothetical protein